MDEYYEYLSQQQSRPSPKIYMSLQQMRKTYKVITRDRNKFTKNVGLDLHITMKNKIFSGYFIKIAERFAKTIEQSFDIKKYDLIHAHGMYGIPAGLIAKILAEKYGKPFIITLHGSDVNLIMPHRCR